MQTVPSPDDLPAPVAALERIAALQKQLLRALCLPRRAQVHRGRLLGPLVEIGVLARAALGQPESET